MDDNRFRLFSLGKNRLTRRVGRNLAEKPFDESSTKAEGGKSEFEIK